MFRDLKEYQQIQKIYEERVCITEEERYITKELKETFTEDELDFIAENTEEVFAEINNQLVEEGSEIAEETIDEMAKAVAKAVVPLATRMKNAAIRNKNLLTKSAAGGGAVAKKAVAGGGAVAKKAAGGGEGLMKKAGGLIKKGVGFVKKNAAKVAGAVGVGGAAAGVATAINKSKPKVETDASGKVIPSTASIRAKSDRVGGGNAGASTDAGKASTANMPKATPVSAEPKKKLSGKERAQQMARERIKSGKTIQQVKDENKAKMIANARQRNVDFKAKRRKPPGEMKSNFAGGVSGKGKATDDFSKDPRYQSTAGTSTDIKKPERQMGRSAAKRRQMAGEEYTPYDIVLEYLLSSKQAATIEEANYIMTEMDAKTIQSIVAE